MRHALICVRLRAAPMHAFSSTSRMNKTYGRGGETVGHKAIGVPSFLQVPLSPLYSLPTCRVRVWSPPFFFAFDCCPSDVFLPSSTLPFLCPGACRGARPEYRDGHPSRHTHSS
mmetsp:Transcript_238/g.596  ORF Transcript_238/g.596 Transcript_238/m.596 type:complete len:114 (-) Transcript_238:481-822(-)